MSRVAKMTGNYFGGTLPVSGWARWGRLQPGASIIAGEPLFPRYQPQKS